MATTAIEALIAGTIRTWTVTDAARYDGREPGGLPDKTDTASSVWVDTAYRSKKNEKGRAGLEGSFPHAARQTDA